MSYCRAVAQYSILWNRSTDNTLFIFGNKTQKMPSKTLLRYKTIYG